MNKKKRLSNLKVGEILVYPPADTIVQLIKECTKYNTESAFEFLCLKSKSAHGLLFEAGKINKLTKDAFEQDWERIEVKRGR